MATKKLKPVLVTTQHRGVFFGYVPANQDMTARTMALTGARMAIRWNTTKGVAELAELGPNKQSKCGSRADIAALHDIMAVWLCTEAATAAWEAAP